MTYVSAEAGATFRPARVDPVGSGYPEPMNESANTPTESETPNPGHEPASGHPDVPSQSGANDPQGRDVGEDQDSFVAGQGENDAETALGDGGPTQEHGATQGAPGPDDPDAAGPGGPDQGGVDEGEPTPGDAPADPVDEGDDATDDPNESGEPEPGEFDPTQLG
jgi:hypothetical protein